MDVLTKAYPTIPLSGYSELVRRYLLTFNVQLILKMRDIIFFCEQSTSQAILRDILRGQKR